MNAAAIGKMRFVLLSNASVLALGIVFRLCSTTKLAGLFSPVTVSVGAECFPCSRVEYGAIGRDADW